MTLSLYLHPFSSFCQKVLIAFYERDVPFEPVILDSAEKQAALERLWPLGKFPVLRDEARGLTVPESSLIVEYLDRIHPGPPPLVPAAGDEALQVRILDRFFDNYVMVPMQRIVGNALRPEGNSDPFGVDQSKASLARAYDIVEAWLPDDGQWAAGDSFTLADCAAAPSLFYANMVEPFAGRPKLEAYYRRLRARPSFARAVDEARPYRHYFPLPWLEGWD
ncbi:MAG: glutathione S-transferase family protein [Allosphingosinicella sp.]